MTGQPKRIPGERNPEPQQDAVDHVAREAWMTRGGGTRGPGIAGAVFALLDWRKRRKASRRR